MAQNLLDSMKWTKLEQKGATSLMNARREIFGQAIYKNHLISLEKKPNDVLHAQRRVLCCWNISISFLTLTLILNRHQFLINFRRPATRNY